MSIKTVISCDVCGVDRKDVNHWFTIRIGVAGSFVTISGVENINEAKHVCGVAHAQVLYSRFLSHGTLEPEMSEPLHPQELIEK